MSSRERFGCGYIEATLLKSYFSDRLSSETPVAKDCESIAG